MTKQSVVRRGTKYRRWRVALGLLACAVLAACATNPPMPVTDNLSAPLALVRLVRLVCESWSYPHIPDGAHWDGGAHLVWTTNEEVIAVECSVTSMSGGLQTLETRVGIREERARALRDFLARNDVPVHAPWGP